MQIAQKDTFFPSRSGCKHRVQGPIVCARRYVRVYAVRSSGKNVFHHPPSISKPATLLSKLIDGPIPVDGRSTLGEIGDSKCWTRSFAMPTTHGLGFSNIYIFFFGKMVYFSAQRCLISDVSRVAKALMALFQTSSHKVHPHSPEGFQYTPRECNLRLLLLLCQNFIHSMHARSGGVEEKNREG